MDYGSRRALRSYLTGINSKEPLIMDAIQVLMNRESRAQGALWVQRVVDHSTVLFKMLSDNLPAEQLDGYM